LMSPANPKPVAQAFFSGLIDYAGLFPPAALPLPNALENFNQYQHSPLENWILGQFILLPAHLDELLDKAELILPSFHKQIQLSLATKAPFTDFARFSPPLAQYKDALRVKSLEIVIDQTVPVKEFVSSVIDLSATFHQGGRTPSLFFEAPPSPNWEETTLHVLDEITTHLSSGFNGMGFKLRCGGSRTLIPSPQRIAFVLRECARRSIPIKFTAGLHQPFCHVSTSDPAVIEWHGFCNLFFASLLAYREETAEQQLLKVLTQNGSTAPLFLDDTIEWLGHSISAIEIAQLRSTRVTSFGSCSFTEPIEEARKLSWL
jgi:hypothetical protein